MKDVFYKQKFSKFKNSFTIIEVIAWIGEEVLLEDVKTGLRYVLTSEEFLQFHESLKFECDISEYNGWIIGEN